MSGAAHGKVTHPAPHRDRVSNLRLFAALTLAPAAWMAQLLASYFFSANACAPRSDGVGPDTVPVLWLLLLVINALCLVAGLLGITFALQSWNRTRGEKEGGAHRLIDVGEGRTRFTALSAVIVSLIFLFAILCEFAALLILQRCSPGDWL